MMIKRRKTRIAKIGSIKIGGKFPISIQSMTKTDTKNVPATVRQIKSLEKVGCEIVRVALKDKAEAGVLDKIKSKINIPLVADIHFNYRLALEAIQRGVDAIRLNPGNIYRQEEVRQIAEACKKKRIPIRVGVNSGSLRDTRYTLTGTGKIRDTLLADSMVKSALDYIKLLERFDFYDIIISLKASSVTTTVDAYRKLASRCRYPFHLGVTATGLLNQGTIKSAIGIGSLLLAGIGDTIRVSLSAQPAQEVTVAQMILQALGLRNFGPEIIACPTCGRTKMNVVKIAQELQKKLPASPPSLRLRTGSFSSFAKASQDKQLPTNHLFKIAIMGCEVNGPGEAGDADIGVACGKGSALLFRKGKIIKKVKESQIVNALIKHRTLNIKQTQTKERADALE